MRFPNPFAMLAKRGLVGRAAMLGVFGYFTVADYREKMEKGWPRSLSTLYAGAMFGGWMLYPAPMTALMAMGLTTNLGEKFYQVYRRRADWYTHVTRPFFGRPFVDTEATATMRQRAIASMMDMRTNFRGNFLGNEAKIRGF